ncbi:TPA: pyocin, partial [Pseudomonas aeruginosa]
MSGYVPNNRNERPAPKPEAYNGDFDRQPARPLVADAQPETPRQKLQQSGCVFAKSCSLPDGVIDHRQPGNFIPLESLKTYG